MTEPTKRPSSKGTPLKGKKAPAPKGGRTPVRSVTREPTRGALLAGTLRCLRLKGLAGTTSREIAREAGTNLQAITYHFGSKEELVSQALLEAIRTWIEPAVEILRGTAPPPLRLIQALQLLQESFERAHDLLPAYLEALVQASRHEVLRNGVREILTDLRTFLVDQMQEMKSAGFLPAWIDPPAMATLLLATADGVALHSALDPASVSHQAVSAQALQLLLAAAQSASKDGR